MKLESIYDYCKNPPPANLNHELAVCYILSVLVEGESYGTELIQQLEQQYPGFKLSDTVLYASLSFLEQQQYITDYWKKTSKRGRPRRMYQLTEDPEVQTTANELAGLWRNYVQQQVRNTGEVEAPL